VEKETELDLTCNCDHEGGKKIEKLKNLKGHWFDRGGMSRVAPEPIETDAAGLNQGKKDEISLAATKIDANDTNERRSRASKLDSSISTAIFVPLVVLWIWVFASGKANTLCDELLGVRLSGSNARCMCAVHVTAVHPNVKA